MDIRSLEHKPQLNITPARHAVMLDHYRVPVYVKPPEYTVCLGNDFVRMFTEETLPDYVMSKIVIAKATQSSNTVYPSDSFAWWTDMMSCKDERLADTGWRASENMYIVVISGGQLSSLLGGTVY
jgi:hypothetical protein